MKQSRNYYLPWLILIGLVLTWGSSFILIKQGLEGFSNDSSIVGALRIVITFIVLLPLALMRLKKVKRKDWGVLVIVGIISNAAPAFLFAHAQTGIDSNMAGILNSLTTLFTLLIGLAFFRLKPKYFNILGVFAGLSGAIGLIYFSGDGGFILNFSYAAYIFIATVFYAAAVNIIKTYLVELDAVSITAVSFLIIGLPVCIYLFFFTGFLQQLTYSREAWTGLGYISILAVVGTALALIFFNMLIKMTTALFAASVTYMIPIVAIGWGILDGEQFEWNYLIWTLLILGGVYLVNVKHLFSKKTDKTFVQ
ncbi:MAG: DMT family transporter [Bacteroidales bacterium]|nr:DMT family transporter [Bacteroidales bacterium]